MPTPVSVLPMMAHFTGILFNITRTCIDQAVKQLMGWCKALSWVQVEHSKLISARSVRSALLIQPGWILRKFVAQRDLQMIELSVSACILLKDLYARGLTHILLC